MSDTKLSLEEFKKLCEALHGIVELAVRELGPMCRHPDCLDYARAKIAVEIDGYRAKLRKLMPGVPQSLLTHADAEFLKRLADGEVSVPCVRVNPANQIN